MAWLYRIGLCLGIIGLNTPVSHQQSPSSLFLISVPEQIHAGMSTSLAVTVLANFSVRVTAEVAQGNVKIEKSEDFTKDMTGLLSLPPIYNSSLRSPFTLTVKGYKGDEVIFTNTTNIAFSPRNLTTFIQTDRPRYQPGDHFRVRVVSVYLDNYPYNGKVELNINNPSGTTVDSTQFSGNNGIIVRDLTLPQAAPLGRWTVTTTINGLTDDVTFLVEHFDDPVFDVLINTPSYVLSNEDISGSVRALYPSGQPVHGSVNVTLTLIYGSAQFHFSKDTLHPLNAMVQSGKDVMIHIHAAVTVNSTVNRGVEVTKQVEVQVSSEKYHLTLHDYPQALKPGMEFFAKLKITRFDQRSLSSAEMSEPALIEIVQRTSTNPSILSVFTYPVLEDGIVHLSFRLQAEVEELILQARFQSNSVPLTLTNVHQSPSGSYIQISPINSTQIGTSAQITLESSVQPNSLHYVVRSRGQVVAAGRKQFGSFTLTPTAAWIPQACVTVYCVLADGEIMSDTADILVKQQPQVTLSVTGPESGSGVGIVIMGTDDSAPDASINFEMELKCSVRMLTNGKLYNLQLFDGSIQADMIEKYWYQFIDGSESLLWLDATMSDTTWNSEKITVPDGVNSLRAAAFVMSQRDGLSFTSQKLSVIKDFSLSLSVPPFLIRGEEIVLEVNIINHLQRNLEVILLLAESDAFQFVMAERGGLSVVNAQKLTLGSHVSAKAMFPIRVTALGEVDISVDAVSADASESLVWTVFVKPEGVEESVSENLFLEPPPTVNNYSISAAFSFPAGVIADTRRAQLAIGGDILALSMNQLDSLVDLPVGCGEQNMVHFAPSIYILRYMEASGLDDAGIRMKAMKHLEEGYQRQLSYQRMDGSFGAFGSSDISGSTWLTAFVVKCFQQAQSYITVDQNVLTRARDWLLNHQTTDGEFREMGTAMHTEMQAGLDNGQVALTAYVLITLLEDQTTVGRYSDQVLRAQAYLENKISTGIVSNYSLSLTAYALMLASSSYASKALTELNRRADTQDGTSIWMSSGSSVSHNQPHSVQIEMAAYLLMAFYKNADIEDTVIALQALANFAAFSGSNAIDLKCRISSPTTPFSSIFHINSTNYRQYQSQEIIADNDFELNIHMEGSGFATFQMNLFYNMESKTFSENLQRIMNEEAFSMNVEVYSQGDDYDRLHLSICMKLKDTYTVSKTGMAILDVAMLSGFTISPGATAPTDLIPKTEILADKIILYFHTLNTTEICVTLPLIRIYKVARTQDAVVRVYDYYEPSDEKSYPDIQLDDLRTMGSCAFCGEDCELCQPGLSIIVSVVPVQMTSPGKITMTTNFTGGDPKVLLVSWPSVGVASTKRKEVFNSPVM
ncbi:hypothetical protein WMY93_017406 [Mugilogobius chulae]|uniref:CD109 antigen-like n=1 Tax=Mugilogobius chulae TaxID=88201 RepID=A0AAW0NSG9_9GOBI